MLVNFVRKVHEESRILQRKSSPFQKKKNLEKRVEEKKNISWLVLYVLTILQQLASEAEERRGEAARLRGDLEAEVAKGDREADDLRWEEKEQEIQLHWWDFSCAKLDWIVFLFAGRPYRRRRRRGWRETNRLGISSGEDEHFHNTDTGIQLQFFCVRFISFVGGYNDEFAIRGRIGPVEKFFSCIFSFTFRSKENEARKQGLDDVNGWIRV